MQILYVSSDNYVHVWNKRINVIERFPYRTVSVWGAVWGTGSRPQKSSSSKKLLDYAACALSTWPLDYAAERAN
jgi:hypothetical protein